MEVDDETLIGLFAALEEDRRNTDLMLVIADRLDELGLCGGGMRWAAKTGRSPCLGQNWTSNQAVWSWWSNSFELWHGDERDSEKNHFHLPICFSNFPELDFMSRMVGKSEKPTGAWLWLVFRFAELRDGGISL